MSDASPAPRNAVVLGQGRFTRLMAANGWEWVERVNASGAVVIAATTDDGRLVLVEQYRIPMDCRVIELPAGLVGDTAAFAEEEMIEAARRELLEETGYEASDWRPMIEGPSSAGLTTETYMLWLARHARRVGPGGGDPSEQIEVHSVPLGQLDAWLDTKRAAGVAVDPKVYVGAYFIERYPAK